MAVKNKKTALVTGAGGFIGHHMVNYLKKKGYWVRGVDIKYPMFEKTNADEFELLDLRRWPNALQATRNVDEVYNFAADMGGMGFISCNHSIILHNNLLISTHVLEAARINDVKKIFFSSSACIYPEYKQTNADVISLKEEDAYPAEPQDAYGWEKLITEQTMTHYGRDYKIKTRIARFHNIYGPLGTWDGGREKVPAAFCRKIALAKMRGDKEIEVWGDGKQTRSFCYIDDCVEGVYKLMKSNIDEPLNIGSDRLISVNDLADMVADIAGIKIKKKHIKGPQGVRGRNSDNTKVKKLLKWEPNITLEEGMTSTYQWIEKQVKETYSK